ncbi:MAG TPA: hypothetical protein VK030_05850, partial [Actinomycetales bacterium]|nr:hypothetical protein [Actinomycetales bacterium]
LAAARAHDSRLTPTQLQRFGEADDYLQVAPSVINVVTDIKIEDDATPVPLVPHDEERLGELAAQWGLNSPVERLLEAVTAMSGG